jgi:hypothetical protein
LFTVKKCLTALDRWDGVGESSYYAGERMDSDAPQGHVVDIHAGLRRQRRREGRGHAGFKSALRERVTDRVTPAIDPSSDNYIESNTAIITRTTSFDLLIDALVQNTAIA